MLRQLINSERDDRLPGGQALAEFAIVLPILALLFLSILQFALIYNAQVGLTNAVRDAARFGSSQIANSDASAAAASTSTGAFLLAALPKYVVPFDAASVNPATQVSYCSYADPSPLTSNSVRVKVRAVYGHSLFIPLVGLIIDGLDGTPDQKFTMTSSLDMRVDNPASPAPTVTAVCVP